MIPRMGTMSAERVLAAPSACDVGGEAVRGDSFRAVTTSEWMKTLTDIFEGGVS